LEREIRRALEYEQFEVYYQPIIELGTYKIVSLEALARWKHPERGLLDAEAFHQAAEETGLIRPIGRRVFEETCRQAKTWHERYPNEAPLISVNLLLSQFVQQPDLVQNVLSNTRLSPWCLQLEITERAVVDYAELSLHKLQELKELGVSFALDDYGIGYSGLYYLKHLPLDSLKIDRTFIAGLEKDPADEAIAAGTIGLAHALGVVAVAEGVETEGQLGLLRSLGCRRAQGYLFSRPLPAEEVRRLLPAGAGR